MKREIQKYPYNARIEDDIKKYLSDQICEQVVSITYRNRQFFFTIKNKISHQKREIAVSAALIWTVLFGIPKQVGAIGVAPIVTSAPEIHRPARQHFNQYAPTVNRRLDKIYFMPNKETIPLIYLNAQHVYVNEKILKRLRAGDITSNITVVAISVVVYIMFQLVGIDAFQIISNWNAPHPNSHFGIAPSSSSTEIGLVPTQAQEFNEPKPNFIMTRDDALKLLKETYGGSIQITDNERISDWQAAKKIYHASDFGVNPEDYGMTKYQLRQINRVGLTKYIRLGNPLPPVKLIKDYQSALKGFCKNSERLPSGIYNSRGDQKVHKSSFYYNDNTRIIVAFNIETHELITAGIYKLKDFSMFRVTKNLGRL